MSTTTAARPTNTMLKNEVEALRRRVELVEANLSKLCGERSNQPPQEDWRAALKRYQDGWASMTPEFRSECLATFDDVRREIRNADGDA
jgi:hypothetical protein